MNTNKEIWPKSYVSAPHLPDWFARELARFGGYNYAAKPIYRVVWGMDARWFMNGNPRAIKYQNPNDVDLGWAAWMLERYASPEFFDARTWEESRWAMGEDGQPVDLIGPFPSQGDYILVAPLVANDEFQEPSTPLPLERRVLDELLERLSPGPQVITALGAVDIIGRRKKAERAARVEKLLQERMEYYRQNEERINATHSATQVLLGKVSPKNIARTARLVPPPTSTGSAPARP